ncbi:MAG: SufB/SufD family protein, partial [Planctomycetia bacterium]
MTSATAQAAPAAAFDREALEQLIASSASPDWVSQRRRAAFDLLSSLGLPDRRSENWMRTDLRLFKPKAWGLRPRPAVMTAPDGLLAEAIASESPLGLSTLDDDPRPVARGSIAGRFASLDGHVIRDEIAPDLARRGVLFGSAERLLAEHGEQLRQHWFSVIDSSGDWFAALHGAFHRASAVLVVPAGVRIADPLHVMAAIGPGGVDTSHVLVVLGEGAEATLLTETAGGGDATTQSGGFHCGGTEVVVGKGAFLRMVNLQNWSTGVWHVARQKAVVHEHGRIQWTLGALGSRLSQVAQDVALVGRGADAQVNGVMFTEGRQHLVYNTLQHHEAPSCKSDLLYKGALQDRSWLVWRGMIKVDKAAQKTDGYQRNGTLRRSNESRADS